MSPSRARKKGRKNNKPARPPVLAELPGRHEERDSFGMRLDPQSVIDEMTAGAGQLLGSEDPLDAELMASALVGIGMRVGEESLVDGFIARFEARATTESMAMLLAIASLTDDRVRKAACAVADRLAEAGIAEPSWADELFEPVTVAECQRLIDIQETASFLGCTFHRAGREHGLLIAVDHQDCGIATDILVLDARGIPSAVQAMLLHAQRSGHAFTMEPLAPGEFRWHVENALDARAVHDSDKDQFGPVLDELDDDDDYPGDGAELTVLIRARMRGLPVSDKPKPRHGDSGRRGDPRLELAVRVASQWSTGEVGHWP